jgi:hypothetical protein
MVKPTIAEAQHSDRTKRIIITISAVLPHPLELDGGRSWGRL